MAQHRILPNASAWAAGRLPMRTEPIHGAVVSAHARWEMERRGLSEETVRSVLAAPGQRWQIRPGRDILQSRVVMGDPPRMYLVRVIVEVGPGAAVVVTAYRTSKVSKYWRTEE